MVSEKSKNEEQKILTVAIDERVDSTNAEQLGSELEDVRQKNPGYTIVLDVEEMPYISSAGLRVLLKLRKQQGDLKVTNVSTEVYEIFEVTGFTEILDVQKAFRKISVEGCPLIGEGGYGRVYRLNGDTVVKVYHEGVLFDEIKKEQDYSRKAFLSEIPTAIPFDVVQCNGCYGLVYELIDAKTLSATIKENPDDLDKYAKKWAELLKILHTAEVKPGVLTNVKDLFHEWANLADFYLTKEEIEQIHGLIDRIPDRNCIIHGDAHVKNIMMQQDEPILIDMASICVGHPIFDLSGIYLTHMMQGPYCEIHLGLTQEISESLFVKMIHYYFNIPQEESIDEILKTCAVFALMKFALAPAFAAGTRASEIADKIVGTVRKNFFPVVDHLPGNTLDIFE